MGKKAFASDFDGTIFFNNREEKIAEKDIEAIERFQKAGHLFGFCTGRPYAGISPYFNQVRPDFCITSSGALITDGDGNVLFEKEISGEVAEKILDYVERTYRIEGNLHTDRHHKIHDVSFRLQDEDDAQMLARDINRRFGTFVEAFQNVDAVDIVPLGCSKGAGLRYVRDHLDAKETYGIGDSMNDLSLIKAANHSFTFHRSPEGLQRNAEHVVGSLDEAIHLAI